LGDFRRQNAKLLAQNNKLDRAGSGNYWPLAQPYPQLNRHLLAELDHEPRRFIVLAFACLAFCPRHCGILGGIWALMAYRGL
jgi:hypothetical protein